MPIRVKRAFFHAPATIAARNVTNVDSAEKHIEGLVWVPDLGLLIKVAGTPEPFHVGPANVKSCQFTADKRLLALFEDDDAPARAPEAPRAEPAGPAQGQGQVQGRPATVMPEQRKAGSSR